MKKNLQSEFNLVAEEGCSREKINNYCHELFLTIRVNLQTEVNFGAEDGSSRE